MQQQSLFFDDVYEALTADIQALGGNKRVAAGQFIQPKYEGKTPFWLNVDVDGYIANFFAGEERQKIGEALHD